MRELLIRGKAAEQPWSVWRVVALEGKQSHANDIDPMIDRLNIHFVDCNEWPLAHQLQCDTISSLWSSIFPF